MLCYTYNGCPAGCYVYPTEHELVQTSKFSLYDQIVTSEVKDKSTFVVVCATKERGRSRGTAALDSKSHHKLRMSGQLQVPVTSLTIQSIA
jgi:hypothetical protein